MTSSKNSPSLIAEIDSILNRGIPALPWLQKAHTVQQQQLLEKVRDYLLSLNTIEDATEPTAATAIAKAVVEQMQKIQGDSLPSLQEDVAKLHQDKASLEHEIEQLQEDRQQIVAEFLPILTSRFAESVTQQLNQVQSTLEGNLRQIQRESYANSSQLGTDEEQLQQLQTNSEQLLINLDATFQTVLGALERDLNAYQNSLSQGLEQMHSLGQQGEGILAALINRLTQHLQYTVVDTSVDKSDTSDNLPLLAESQNPEVINFSPPSEVDEEKYPYAGMEIIPSATSIISEVAQVESLLEIDLGGSEIILETTHQDVFNSPLFTSEEGIATNQTESADSENSESNFFPPTPDQTIGVIELNSQTTEGLTAEASLFAQLEDPALTTTTPINFDEPVTSLTEELFGSEMIPEELEVSEAENTPAEPAKEEDTITSLQELLAKINVTASSDLDDGEAEENYTPASSGENLLLTDDSQGELLNQPMLDSQQQQYLEEDLQRFETEETLETPSESSES